ncbi:MAG TPA: glycosyltransferase family 1 protein [bacterium]|nr:glycosyltransferase family 1 protein [bacterium]
MNAKIDLLMEGHSLLPPRTGIGRSTAILLRQLALCAEIGRVGIFLSIFPFGGHWRSSVRAVQELGVEVQVHRIPLPYGVLMRLWKWMERPRVDRWIGGIGLVHGPANVLPARMSVPAVVTVHDLSLLEHPEWYPRRSRPFQSQIRRSLQGADGVITPSGAVREAVLRLRPALEGRVWVVPHGIDGGFAPISEEEKAATRRDVLAIDGPYLLWSGEINPRKNIPALFVCLSALKQGNFPHLRLVLTGTAGYQGQAILRQAEELGLRVARWLDDPGFAEADVLLVEYAPEEVLRLIYAAAEVLVFPSWDEGFGFPVLEAMAAGVPVVCSSRGALGETAGDAALMADPREGPGAFVQPVRRLLDNPGEYQRLRRAGLERVKQFPVKRMAERTVQVYQQVIAARGG